MSATQNGQQTSSEQQEMPLIEHLLELRNRLLKMVKMSMPFGIIYNRA